MTRQQAQIRQEVRAAILNNRDDAERATDEVLQVFDEERARAEERGRALAVADLSP